MQKLNKTILICFLLFQSCTYNFNKTISYNSEKFIIKCQLGNLETVNINNKKYTEIYGTLNLINISNEVVKIDLKKISVLINNKFSGELNINSIGSVMLMEETLKPGVAIEKSIYWGFDRTIQRDSIKSIELAYNI